MLFVLKMIMNLVIFLREYQNMYQACINQEVIIGILRTWDHSLYLSQLPQPAVVYFFRDGVPFSLGERRMLAFFGPF